MAAKTKSASPTKATAKKATKKTSTANKPTASKTTTTKTTTTKATATKTVAKKAAPKKTAAKKTATKATASAVATPPTKRASRAKARSDRAIFLPRAVASVDDDNPLMAHGGGGGGFGRCGGRMLSNRYEQQLCNRLGVAGVVHSHSPRHYEIRLDETKVAAYAPMIVLRGRGREGKGVIIEAIEDAKAPILTKVIAFREQYGQEFYIILVADDEVLDEVPLSCYDESCSSTNVHTLIARLAE